MTLSLLIAAMIQVESGGNDLAVGKRGEVGCLQITRAVVRDVNRVYGKHYTLADRFDRKKSIEMCQLYLAHYATTERLGHMPTLEDCARIWNGGPQGWRKRATVGYWHKVDKAMKDNERKR